MACTALYNLAPVYLSNLIAWLTTCKHSYLVNELMDTCTHEDENALFQLSSTPERLSQCPKALSQGP